jgi:hypothetical protein
MTIKRDVFLDVFVDSKSSYGSKSHLEVYKITPFVILGCNQAAGAGGGAVVAASAAEIKTESNFGERAFGTRFGVRLAALFWLRIALCLEGTLMA